MLGAVDVYEGEVLVDGVVTLSLSKGQKRPRIGYVPQLETIDWNFPVTVREVVMMGRTMENRFFPWFRQEEKALADRMMDQLGILHLAGVTSANCPAASSSALSSPARWSAARHCCCWTNPLRAWT